VRVFALATGATVYDGAAAPLAIQSIALSPDGSRLAIAPLDLPIQLWDVSSRQRIADLPAQFAGATAVAFSPDGTLLATSNGDTTVRIHHAATGREVARFDELLLEPLALDFTPDSKTLVVGGADGVFTALDASTGKARSRSPRIPDPIGALAVLPDGKTAVAVTFLADSMDSPGNVVAWSLGAGLKTLATGLPVSGGGVGGGRLLLTSPEGKALKLWAVR
jgi:WD40 repeat protein